VTRPEDLPAEAESVFDVYRWMGVSESAAMDLLAQDGLVEQRGIDRAAATFGSVFGLSAEAAATAARGRMSASEAKRFWDSSGGGSSNTGGSSTTCDVFEATRRTLDAMSDAEVEQMLVEEQQRRKNHKVTPAQAGGPAKRQPTVVSEWGRRK
jgi:hypothetical protein